MREVASGDNPKPGAQRLEKDGHQIGDQDDAQKSVAKGGAARQIRRPVARIHVADGYEVARPGESQHFPPEAQTFGDRDRAMHFLQTGRLAGKTPPWFGGIFFDHRLFSQKRQDMPMKRTISDSNVHTEVKLYFLRKKVNLVCATRGYSTNR